MKSEECLDRRFEGESQFATAQKYADIIDMPHHVSKRHPQMSMWNRAAQFAPFSALTGYEDAIKDTAHVFRGASTDFCGGSPENSQGLGQTSQGLGQTSNSATFFK